MISGCEKNFLDINTDPKNPVDLPLTQILPAAELGLTYNLSMKVGGLNSASSTFAHQIYNNRVNEYVVDGTTFQTDWSYSGGSYGFYSGPLQDFERIINKGRAQNAPHFVGVAQVQKAHMFSVLTDLFGDIPYSQALLGNENIAPSFDKAQDIYPALFALLDEAIANLGAASSSISPDASTDFIYSGNRVKWIKLANSIKLKLYNQLRLTKDYKAQINAIIASGNYIQTEDEDFQVKFGTSTAPENRNPGFFANYNSASGSRESWVNLFLYTTLKNTADPRMPYYVYNQLATATSAPQNPPDFRDGRFITTRFASQGPNKTQAMSTSQSLLGFFPVGGRYDDGAGGLGTLTNAPANAPLRILPSYNVRFILAESALTTGTSGNARQLLDEGIRLNFAKINLQAAAATVQTVPQIPAAAINTYVASVLAAYDAGDAAKKLEIIMTQKWLASYGYGIDAYTDYRRTGYPVIPDPATDGDPETVSQRTFVHRFPYPNPEITSNPNAPAQPDVYTSKLFWAK